MGGGQAYRMCPLDETHIEAAHRDVSHIGHHATASKMAFRASTFRTTQNIAALEGDNGPLRQWVEHAYSQATAVMRNPCPLPLRSLRRKTLDDAAKYVYRLGDDKFHHWYAFERSMALFSPKRSSIPMSGGARVQLYYIRSLIQNYSVYSLPLPTEAQLAHVCKGASLEAALVLFESGLADPVNDCIFFKVLDVNVKHKKLLPTSKLVQAMKGMTWPVRIQRLQIAGWGDRGPYPAPSYDLDCDGAAEIVDFAGLAPWSVMRVALRKWETLTSEYTGCRQINRSLCMALQPLPKQASAVPVLLCLETLVNTGWRVGKPPPLHTSKASKCFKLAADPVGQKCYLQCLLALEALEAAGCNGVCPGKGAKVYGELLGSLEQGPLLASTQDTSAAAADPDTKADPVDEVLSMDGMQRRGDASGTTRMNLVERAREVLACAWNVDIDAALGKGSGHPGGKEVGRKT